VFTQNTSFSQNAFRFFSLFALFGSAAMATRVESCLRNLQEIISSNDASRKEEAISVISDVEQICLNEIDDKEIGKCHFVFHGYFGK